MEVVEATTTTTTNNGNNNNQGNNNAGQGGDQAAGNGNNNNNNNNGGGGGNGGGSGGATAASALGGIAAPEVADSGNGDRPFSVNGNTFVNKAAAVQRACDVQNNLCSDAVNGGKLQGVDLGACGSQVAQCVSELS